MDTKKFNYSRISILENIRETSCGTDLRSQCNRMLKAMQLLGDISTIEAREWLDILHPPARKLNLIQDGHIIKLTWVYEQSKCGYFHRVGKYIYLGTVSLPLF